MRKIAIVSNDQKINSNSIAQILARHITGGDYTGYLQKIAQKEKEQLRTVG